MFLIPKNWNLIYSHPAQKHTMPIFLNSLGSHSKILLIVREYNRPQTPQHHTHTRTHARNESMLDIFF